VRRGQAAASGAGAGLREALQQLDFLLLFHLRKKKGKLRPQKVKEEKSKGT